jgi:hypothetical protein
VFGFFLVQGAEVLLAEPLAHLLFRPSAQAESTSTHHFFFKD